MFDERLGERITDDVLAQCYQCDAVCDDYTNCANVECNLLFIQCGDCKEKLASCCSAECQAIAALPEAEQMKRRKGKILPKNQAVFKKKIAVA